MYIRKEIELEDYGYTLGCEGCTAAALGQRPRNRSEECRARIEQAMKAAGKEGRLIEAGLTIATFEVQGTSLSVDTAEQLEQARAMV